MSAWRLSRNMFVRPSGRAMRLGRIDIASEPRRWRSRELATTTTTATRQPLACLTFLVEDSLRWPVTYFAEALGKTRRATGSFAAWLAAL
jgi:hypothetical protein